jgi:hypothetical protein
MTTAQKFYICIMEVESTIKVVPVKLQMKLVESLFLVVIEYLAPHYFSSLSVDALPG